MLPEITAWVLIVSMTGTSLTLPTMLAGIASEQECERIGREIKSANANAARLLVSCKSYQMRATFDLPMERK